MFLQVLDTPDPEPLPNVDSHLDPTPRRPGELHEAVAATAVVRRDAAALAAGAGVAASVAATVLLEAHIVRGDLARAEREPSRSNGNSCIQRRLSAAEADYLRSLTARRGRPASRSVGAALLIPLRLLPWAKPQTLAQALRDDIEQALAWEVQALLAGATLREWVLMGVLSG